ncbi:MAG TPA: alpha-ketoglutarate-dependent dioxygenase AlkB [Nostocaceae cyanobacterium]|nr:alpha-ketoglutarate-dependent dioxygenase AlkB [Nostocaceae cyanobacterium]
MQQLELLTDFAPNIPVEYHPGFLNQLEATNLFEHCKKLKWQQNQFEIFGKINDLPRLECMYGETGAYYVYSRGRVKLEANPWTPELLWLKNKVEEFCKYRFQVVIGNLYRHGQDSIGWHSDNEPSMGKSPAIASISLGASRKFSIKSKLKDAKPYHYRLEHGSLLLMLPGCQEGFVHEVPKDNSVLKERINLTFRPYIFNHEKTANHSQ